MIPLKMIALAGVSIFFGQLASGAAIADPPDVPAPFDYRLVGKKVFDVEPRQDLNVSVDVETTTNSIAVQTSCTQNTVYDARPNDFSNQATLADGSSVLLRAHGGITPDDHYSPPRNGTWYFDLSTAPRVSKLTKVNLSVSPGGIWPSSGRQRCALFIYDHRYGLQQADEPALKTVEAYIDYPHTEALSQCLGKQLQNAFAANHVDDVVLAVKADRPTPTNGCYTSEYFSVQTRDTTYSIGLDAISLDYCWQSSNWENRYNWYMSSGARLLRSADNSWAKELTFDVEPCF